MSADAGTVKHPAVAILEDLIRIESVNPHFDASAQGENGVADYIERRMIAAGLPVRRQQVFPGRDNLIIELRTGRDVPTLLFEAHMDTVSLGSMIDPLVPRYQDGKLYGRGACDTKGTLAGMIYTLEQCALNPERLSADIVLCASVDEEHEYHGLRAFMALDMKIDGAVVGEPTEMGIVVAHKGCARFTVQTHGKAAHSSMPHEGNSAVYQMMEVLSFIREKIEPELTQRQHPLCGSPTIVVGTIHGGTQINIVPETCTIEIDRRIIPGENPDEVLAEFTARLHAYAEGKGIKFTIGELLLDWALNTPYDSPIVPWAQQAARTLGLNEQLTGVPYSSDASKLQRRGIPTIVYGPGSIAQAHSREEWVPVREVEQAAEYYLQLALLFGSRQ
ncbi:M20 family metallopeptidase [Paenibacillus contaminans]|uniref:M20 family peptidase n=1 Tax=Paenibacillus contaminans TaxID=450362 RepID=A0A329MM26_9BACL|nr:M20 family metallopeptidase [Paenibacillus contaminans]RAV18957.1 M20 family peptidase [Paenibacillus contaminans]